MSFDELIKWMKIEYKKNGIDPKKLPKGWKKEIKEMFDKMDANGNGEVTKKELEAYIEKYD